MAKWWDTLLISIAIFFLLPPLLAIINDGLNLTLLHVLQQPGLWQAFINSVLSRLVLAYFVLFLL